eukprot:5845439-Heterocapsa_arctica.AAC.1
MENVKLAQRVQDHMMRTRIEYISNPVSGRTLRVMPGPKANQKASGLNSLDVKFRMMLGTSIVLGVADAPRPIMWRVPE